MDINQWYTIRNGKIEAVVVYYDASALSLLDKTNVCHQYCTAMESRLYFQGLYSFYAPKDS